MTTLQIGGHDYTFAFDGFTLDDIKRETGLDLADLSAGAWQRVMTNSSDASRVVAIICREHARQNKLTDRQFARTITGHVIEDARAALEDAGRDFFPQSEWSAIQQNLATISKVAEDMAEALPMLAIVEKMPESMRAGIMAAIGEIGAESISSAQSTVNQSAGGQGVTLSNAATGSQEKLEQADAA